MRRPTDQEGQRLQKIVRRGSASSVRYRRAMMLLVSAGGNRLPVIAQLVQADEDTVRDVIHRVQRDRPGLHTRRSRRGKPTTGLCSGAVPELGRGDRQRVLARAAGGRWPAASGLAHAGLALPGKIWLVSDVGAYQYPRPEAFGFLEWVQRWQAGDGWWG
ncbi:helix-turn-helix domain-containing protein [Streptomyces sp. NPDC001876]|uniref:helix-turn-helix domain-containing protein n=1 Tax=Streptomyces sp. NPDC001876 TaxID=3154402 RepID=UPI0033206D27